MLKLFTAHPSGVGETYWTHLLFACGVGLRMMAGGFACFVHGLLPFLFNATGLRILLALHALAMTKRPRAMPGATGIREPDYAI